MPFAQHTVESLLAYFEAVVKHRSMPSVTKELVFNRLRVLKNEGFAEDVAFAKALQEYNILA